MTFASPPGPPGPPTHEHGPDSICAWVYYRGVDQWRSIDSRGYDLGPCPSKRDAAHPVLTHRNGDKCIWLDGFDGRPGYWFVPLDAGGEGYECSLHDEQGRPTG